MWKLQLAIFSLTLATKLQKALNDWAEQVIRETKGSQPKPEPVLQVRQQESPIVQKVVYCAVCSYDFPIAVGTNINNMECPVCGATAVSSCA